MRFVRSLIIFTFAALVTVTASAAVISIEPDQFPEGTDLRSAFPGVTLSVTTDPLKQVLAASGLSNFNGRNLATTGSLVFGNPPPPVFGVDPGKVWDETTFGLLRAGFAAPASSVSIDFLFDDDDTGVLRAYDGSGSLLESVSVLGDGRGSSSVFCPPFCATFATATITRNSADIAYITAGGQQAEALFLDNLKATVVPLPATVFLLPSGLSVLYWLRRPIA